MPALFIYLIKVNVALLIFCAGYYAVLRHLTFYNLNRAYLVTAIVFSTLYPRLNLSEFLNRHEEIAKPIQVVVVNWQEPVRNITKTFLGHDIWFWLLTAFWTGVTVFAIRLLTQLLSLYKLHKRSEPAQLRHYVIRIIKGNINPFSFWRNIYINPENHPPHELDAILEHEQIHVSEWHTLDILLGEISAICYWFNPGIWLMKRAIRENIEFITDHKILKKGVDCKAYQYSLINVNFGAQNNAIVNHFNISTIKKRIIMMNAKRSSNVNITRYLFLIPAVMCLLLIFSVSKAELNKVAKKSAHMIHTFKTVVNRITLMDEPATSSNTRGNTVQLTAVSHINIAGDSAGENSRQGGPVLNKVMFKMLRDTSKDVIIAQGMPLSVSDTGKIIKVRLNGNNKPVIYINGIKTDDALETISPDKIATVNVKKEGDKGVIYIITKDHADDKTLTGRLTVDTVIIKGLNEKVVEGHQLQRVAITRSSSSLKPTTLTVISRPGTKGNVIVGDTVYTSGAVTIGTAHPALSAVTVRGYASGNKITGIQNYRSFNGAATIDNFSNKLVVIDGKEATQKQLKKVSAADIESVSVLKGDAATDKYGDKGKNGVIIITTKKNN
ncbi:M56 family metallopeptidase [Mucilaginibacter boryungensis]|uniref:TonB-dependent receptor plug domain-containing protein n=1 Tax=Mucilaginibacter boryungensis TaxID=768480 RepID=A0ABR9XFZ4_9SPHI|nr:M56 family metallopeptidase [Mucilaginibacter boryungensis]MBE9666302.1 TonB-dependent receptor plug domain-containing protein [Mucilaginibacter boryungensis]